ncbi:hypothetical protein GE09DRAFT_1270415 [Coniochaeta sp. 2T2.1]|nr:hypothetical protein GE09DRAFT_1270415 [Coniochaeta sp. 2T2.1]
MSFFPSLLRSYQGEPGANTEPRTADTPVTTTIPPFYQSFIDNPLVNYAALFPDGTSHPLGTLPPSLSIGIVGLGTTGCFGAQQLLLSGASVTAYELAPEPGGRLKSLVAADGTSVYELGGMRFPPVEALMYMLAEEHGYGFIPGFPDPGVYPTLIVNTKKGEKVVWDEPGKPPGRIRVINDAFAAFEAEGLTKDGRQALCSFRQMKEWLRSPDIDTRELAVPEWKKHIATFHPCTFETFIRRVFGPAHEWDVPGGESLSESDISLFGDVGFGSGGFKHLFDRSGLYIMKILLNSLEENQSTFAKRSPEGTLSPAPVQDLVRAQWGPATEAGLVSHFNTEVIDITFLKGQKKFKLTLSTTSPGPTTTATTTTTTALHDVVILTTSLRTPLMRRLASPSFSHSNNLKLFSPSVCHAILNLEVIASTKLFNLIPNSTLTAPRGYPRNILTDSVPGQVYTLDYGSATTLVALEEYKWVVGSVEIQDRTAAELHAKVLDTLVEVTKDTPYADLPGRFGTVNGGAEKDLIKIDWQLEPDFQGAFVLPRLGQDEMVDDLVYDFLKLKKKKRKKKGNVGEEEEKWSLPVFNVSDMTAHESGWVEGGLRGMVNVVTAIVDRFGGLKQPAAAPVNLMTGPVYGYGEAWDVVEMEDAEGWEEGDGQGDWTRGCTVA